MLWTPQTGIRHRPRHMSRQRRSARAFGISPLEIKPLLDAVSANGPLRLRLTVDAAEEARLAQTPFQALALLHRI